MSTLKKEDPNKDGGGKLLPVIKDDERPQTKASNLQSCGQDSRRGLVTKELEGTSGSQVARERS